jgi:transcriptional regulator with XRE-family HTH domain
MSTPSTPGPRFRAARLAAGLSQVQAAALAGTTQTRISAFEGSRRAIGLDTLHAWCSACGIDPSSVDSRLAALPARR